MKKKKYPPFNGGRGSNPKRWKIPHFLFYLFKSEVKLKTFAPQCGQANGAGVSATQNCQGSQCQQDNAGTGGGGSDGGTDFVNFQFGDFIQNTQNCQTSQFAQIKDGRKKRASVRSGVAKPYFIFKLKFQWQGKNGGKLF